MNAERTHCVAGPYSCFLSHASQVIQQALHRQPSTAAQYLQQMYAAQQQHLMLQTAALQQQHLSSAQLQSLAAVQQVRDGLTRAPRLFQNLKQALSLRVPTQSPRSRSYCCVLKQGKDRYRCLLLMNGVPRVLTRWPSRCWVSPCSNLRSKPVCLVMLSPSFC